MAGEGDSSVRGLQGGGGRALWGTFALLVLGDVWALESLLQAQLYYSERVASLPQLGLLVNMATAWPTPCVQLLSMLTPLFDRIPILRRAMIGFAGYFFVSVFMILQDRLPVPEEVNVTCMMLLAATTACLSCFTQGSLFPIASVFRCAPLIGALEVGASGGGLFVSIINVSAFSISSSVVVDRLSMLQLMSNLYFGALAFVAVVCGVVWYHTITYNPTFLIYWTARLPVHSKPEKTASLSVTDGSDYRLPAQAQTVVCSRSNISPSTCSPRSMKRPSSERRPATRPTISQLFLVLTLIWEDFLACFITASTRLLLWPATLGALASRIWPTDPHNLNSNGTSELAASLDVRLTAPFNHIDHNWWILLVTLANSVGEFLGKIVAAFVLPSVFHRPPFTSRRVLVFSLLRAGIFVPLLTFSVSPWYIRNSWIVLLLIVGFGFTYGLVIWNVMANAPGSSRLNDGQRGSAAGLMVSSIFLGLAVGASVGLGMSDAMGIHS